MPRVRTQDRSPRGISIAAWESEGGATGPGPVFAQAAAEDRSIIELLGAAVVARWNDLPTSARRAIFEAAADGSEARERLARFLHAHRTDAP